MTRVIDMIGVCSVACMAMLLPGANTEASVLQNNIALSSIGATAFDNGNWVEWGNGYQYDAMLAIDDNNAYSSFWAGLGYLSQEQLWVNFDKRYTINAIYIDELDPTNTQSNSHNTDYAYLTSGLLEYLLNGTWHQLDTISKSTPDYMFSFSPVEADGIRLSVYAATVPPTWANNAAVVYSLEANAISNSAIPEPGTNSLLFIGLLSFLALYFRQHSQRNVNDFA